MYLRSILPLSGILRVWVHFAVSLHSYLLPLPYAISSSKTVTVKRRKKLPLQRGKTCLFISLYSFQMSTRKTKALNRQEIFKIIKNFFQKSTKNTNINMKCLKKTVTCDQHGMISRKIQVRDFTYMEENKSLLGKEIGG